MVVCVGLFRVYSVVVCHWSGMADMGARWINYLSSHFREGNYVMKKWVIVGLWCIIFLWIHYPQTIDSSQAVPMQDEEFLELKEFSEHYHFPNGTSQFRAKLGEQNTWDGNNYQYYIWNDLKKSVQFANSKLYFFDWYTRVDQKESTVIDDARWQVEYWRTQGGGEWRTLNLWNHRWFDPIIHTRNITFIQSYDDTINFMNISYFISNQASCKINIDFLSGETREIRFIWQLTGMNGALEMDLKSRIFAFDDIIISCNDTNPSIVFSYDWVVATKKLNVQLGNFTVNPNNWVHIDPAFSAKQEEGARDFCVYKDGASYTLHGTGADFWFGYWQDDGGHASISWDTEIDSTIASTSDAEMSFYVSDEYISASEYTLFGLYDKGDDDEWWSETEADAAEQTFWEQSMYWNDSAFFDFDGTENTNASIGDAKVGTLVDNWVTHHNVAPGTRSNISITIRPGDDMDSGTMEYIEVSAAEHATQANRPTLTFTYTLGDGVNTAPSAVVHTAISGTLYAGKNFTFICNYTDSDGQADLERLYSAIGDDQYDITLNISAGTGRKTVTISNGSSYVNAADALGSSITNGYQVTWTLNLTFAWTTFDDSSTIDTWAQARDDEPEYSLWATSDSNSDYENDLECETLNVYIDTRYEYGGSSGVIEDGDWFKGGIEVTVNGTIQYEGSSENFLSTYASAVDIELYYDSGATGEKDTVITSGIFNGITYTPTSASGIDTTAYFDVVINDIPTGGSDVTGAGIEITSKRDNEDPTTTFHSITEDNPHTYIYATGQTIYFSDLMGGTDQLSTLAVNGSDSSGAGVYCVTMSAWDDDALWNDTASWYERQYSTDSSETSGSITLYAIDNVGNTDSTPVTITMTEDVTGPTATLTTDADENTGTGYDPNTNYDDDSTIDFTASSLSDGAGSGVPASAYSWNGTAWTSSATKQYSGQSDGNISVLLDVRDNVGNNCSSTYQSWVVVDTDSPTGYTITFTRVNGTYPIQVYMNNLSIYFDPGNNCNNYTTVTVNDDGTIQNSQFWFICWDVDSTFEIAANDTSLPDSKNFYYKGDTNGSFYIQVVNNAGNYQEFNYTAYDTLDGGCGEPPTTTTSPQTTNFGSGSYNMNPWEFFQPYLMPFFTLVPLLGTIGLILLALYTGIRRFFR